jgi:hypothetical protein
MARGRGPADGGWRMSAPRCFTADEQGSYSNVGTCNSGRKQQRAEVELDLLAIDEAGL